MLLEKNGRDELLLIRVHLGWAVMLYFARMSGSSFLPVSRYVSFGTPTTTAITRVGWPPQPLLYGW
jgi:hypothetical protein